MEMIEVSGYVAEEKIEIAKNFLVPKCREKWLILCLKNYLKYFLSALTEENLIITNEAINTLIRSYCRESGVRNLEKHLEKVCFIFLNLIIFLKDFPKSGIPYC